MEVIVHIFHEFYFGNFECVRASIAAIVFNVFNIDTIKSIQIQRGNVIRNDFIPFFIFARMLYDFRAVARKYFSIARSGG